MDRKTYLIPKTDILFVSTTDFMKTEPASKATGDLPGPGLSPAQRREVF